MHYERFICVTSTPLRLARQAHTSELFAEGVGNCRFGEAPPTIMLAILGSHPAEARSNIARPMERCHLTAHAGNQSARRQRNLDDVWEVALGE
jgi:hypothetical protein